MTYINWAKILANAGFTFFTSLASLCTFDYLLGSNLPLNFVLGVAVLVSAIQGCVAFFKELLTNIEKCSNPHPPKNVQKSLAFLNCITLF